MRRNNKQVTTYFILFSLLLIGVVYAILQANLQINGTAKIQANTWDIHFDNIQVNENSVSIGTGDSGATIDPENNCKVDFEVTLSIPGDFYEFTIDVINAGTIDGMIGTLNKTLKVNNEVVSEIPNYLDYSVTYSDGVEIEENHALSAGVTETYKVRLEFKTDIEELPSAATISTSLSPQFIQADNTASIVLHPHNLYDVFKLEAENGNGLVHEYTGTHKDSYTVLGTKKIYHWYAAQDDDTSVSTILEKNNVIFGGFCWQMYRTTDTGGIRLLYNGIPNNGQCKNTGIDTTIGKSAYNNNSNSMVYVGYMYNPNSIVYQYSAQVDEESIFGKGVSYSNGEYTLTNTSSSLDSSHHYTCNNTTGSCSSVRYYYRYRFGSHIYVELNDGKTIEQAIESMLSANDVNQTNSAIKTVIDTWYQNNMTDYTSKLEDTIFCNNRYINNLGGFNPNGEEGGISFVNTSSNPNASIICPNETDQFSISNSKARLTYPVALITAEEMNLSKNLKIYSDTQWYYLMTPLSFNNGASIYDYVNNNFGSQITGTAGVRPVVSLTPETIYYLGDGSKNNPYIVE